MNSRAGRAAILIGLAVVAVVLFIVLSGGSDDDNGGSETTATEATQTDATTATATEPAEPPPEVVELRGGEPVGGVKTLTYSKGEQVRIRVKLDMPQEDVHLHGYDVEQLNPSGTVNLSFKADIEGIFELEAHGPTGDVVLAELRVEPA